MRAIISSFLHKGHYQAYIPFADFIGNAVFLSIFRMVRTEIIHQPEHILADQISAEQAGADNILPGPFIAVHADDQQIALVLFARNADPGDWRKIMRPVFIFCTDDKGGLNTHGYNCS